MVIIKDLVLTVLFLCMFGVLLCFAELQIDLRSSAIQNSVIINSQTRVIQDGIETSVEQRHKINCLKVDMMDLREVLLILQKNEDLLEEEVKGLKSENKKLERIGKNLLYKIEKLERNKDEM